MFEFVHHEPMNNNHWFSITLRT